MKLTIDARWVGPEMNRIFHLVSLHEWNFLFVIGAFVAILSLELLVHVNEVGEVEKDLVKRIIRKSIRANLRDYFVIGNLVNWQGQLWTLVKRRTIRKRATWCANKIIFVAGE